MTRKTTDKPAAPKPPRSPEGAKAKAPPSLEKDLQKKLEERIKQRREVKRMKK